MKSKSLNNNQQEIKEINDVLVQQDRQRPYQRVNILKVKILTYIQKTNSYLYGSLVTMIAYRRALFKWTPIMVLESPLKILF